MMEIGDEVETVVELFGLSKGSRAFIGVTPTCVSEKMVRLTRPEWARDVNIFAPKDGIRKV